MACLLSVDKRLSVILYKQYTSTTDIYSPLFIQHFVFFPFFPLGVQNTKCFSSSHFVLCGCVCVLFKLKLILISFHASRLASSVYLGVLLFLARRCLYTREPSMLISCTFSMCIIQMLTFPPSSLSSFLLSVLPIPALSFCSSRHHSARLYSPRLPPMSHCTFAILPESFIPSLPLFAIHSKYSVFRPNIIFN